MYESLVYLMMYWELYLSQGSITFQLNGKLEKANDSLNRIADEKNDLLLKQGKLEQEFEVCPFIFIYLLFLVRITCVHCHDFVTYLCNGNSTQFNLSFPCAHFMTLSILQSHRDNIKKRDAKLRDVAKENKLSGKLSASFLLDYSSALAVIIL